MMAKCHFAIWTPITGGSGGHLGGPFKIVHHTTEIATAKATLKSYKRNRTDPHFTVDDKNIYQHVDTKYGARSLRNRSGGVQTNRDSAIQIEVVAYAAKPKDPDTLENVARLCRWIEQEHEVPRVWPNGFPKPARRGHDPGGHNRNKKNWDQKAGHYGHCHVPENSHWDPAYTHTELMTIMDGVLSTGDGGGAPSALAPGFSAQPVELAIGDAAGGQLVLTNRIVEVTLDAQGCGTAPIDTAWERVLSVTPFVTKKPSDRPVGEISLGEVDGLSVVALSRGTAHARFQVLIKSLGEATEYDAELAAGCPGDDDDGWQGEAHRDEGILESAPAPDGEDYSPQHNMLEPTEAQLREAEATYVPEDDGPEPTEQELALDELLDDRPDLQEPDSGASAALAPVYWPRNDTNAPDYRHITDFTAESQFDLTAPDIDLLIKANRFEPKGNRNIIALALRGCQLQSGNEQERKTRIGLTDVRPNHVNFRCALGFYYMDEGRLTLFTGSTVPAVYYMEEYYKRRNGLPHNYRHGCNMLPAGCYVFRVGRHSNIRPALRMSEPGNLARDAKATVLRTANDLAYGNADIWDHNRPYDNVHCSYFLHRSGKHKAYFSSAGCLTIRGRRTPSDQWAEFQDVLEHIGRNKRCDLLLLTGKECAIAADLREQGRNNDPAKLRELGRLRAGSQGSEVTKLQRKLGFGGTGYFGPSTKKALTELQRDKGIPADGVYSPTLDQNLGWDVFL